MPLQTLNAADHIDLETLFTYCAQKRAKFPDYKRVCDKRVLDAYTQARKVNLRYNRKTHIMRDDRLKVISRPVNPSSWPEATVEEAQDRLMHEIWCDAVSQYNRDLCA